MRSQREDGVSATTRVKVLSPEIVNIAQGQGFHGLEAGIAARVIGECVGGVPGSESVAGNLTVHIGTWEGHVVPKEAPDKLKRQGGGMAAWHSDQLIVEE